MEAVMPRVLAEPGAACKKYCSKNFYREKMASVFFVDRELGESSECGLADASPCLPDAE